MLPSLALQAESSITVQNIPDRRQSVMVMAPSALLYGHGEHRTSVHCRAVRERKSLALGDVDRGPIGVYMEGPIWPNSLL